jgi:4-hydroxysphinganine ceramide fatty acyl 2-hydroxylase
MKRNTSTNDFWLNRTRLILLVAIPALLPLGAIALYNWLPVLLLKYFFFTKGWIAWTLTEYSMHRWAFHEKLEKRDNPKDPFNHLQHHTHPGDMLITPVMRGLGILAVGFAIWSLSSGPVLLTYFTGWLCGLALYSFMHYFLHQPVAARIVPNLVRQHIWHHCKYPDKCFGVCTTFWDNAFKTLPADFHALPESRIRFYYAHHCLPAMQIHAVIHDLNNHSKALPEKIKSTFRSTRQMLELLPGLVINTRSKRNIKNQSRHLSYIQKNALPITELQSLKQPT